MYRTDKTTMTRISLPTENCYEALQADISTQQHRVNMNWPSTTRRTQLKYNQLNLDEQQLSQQLNSSTDEKLSARTKNLNPNIKKLYAYHYALRQLVTSFYTLDFQFYVLTWLRTRKTGKHSTGTIEPDKKRIRLTLIQKKLTNMLKKVRTNEHAHKTGG